MLLSTTESWSSLPVGRTLKVELMKSFGLLVQGQKVSRKFIEIPWKYHFPRSKLFGNRKNYKIPWIRRRCKLTNTGHQKAFLLDVKISTNPYSRRTRTALLLSCAAATCVAKYFQWFLGFCCLKSFLLAVICGSYGCFPLRTPSWCSPGNIL